MIHTSYFAKSGKLPNAISIARSAPPGFKGEQMQMLAPSYKLLKDYKNFKITNETYTEEFNEQLSSLDPRIVGGLAEGKVLLCWEGKDKFCHRHLVAVWLQKAGFKVEELK